MLLGVSAVMVNKQKEEEIVEVKTKSLLIAFERFWSAI